MSIFGRAASFVALLLLVSGCDVLLAPHHSPSDVRIENETLDAEFSLVVTLTPEDGEPEVYEVAEARRVAARRVAQWDEVFVGLETDAIFVDVDVRWLGGVENYTIDTVGSPGDTLELTYGFDSVSGRNRVTWRWAPF